jgi:hypothetical protein
MPRIAETKVYKFNELSDEVKEKVRDKIRYSGGYLSYDWWDWTYDFVAEAADLIGIDLRTREWKDRKGEKHYDGINILFSGFSSQGDGACFNGSYRYNKGSVKNVKKEFPTETDLHDIAQDLYNVQRRAFYRLYAKVTPGPLSNHYSHYNTRTIEVYDDKELEYPAETWKEFEDGIDEALRDFMKWIYEKLEEEYESLMTDEQVDEHIESNNYEFEEDGTRF